MYALFADLKAAFEKANRNKLWRIMKENGIQEALIERLEKMYEDTEIIVWTRQGNTKEFRTREE